MKYIKELSVTANEQLNEGCFLLKLKSDTALPEIFAGQFVNIQAKNVADRILRRPISIHDVDYSTNELSVVIQKVGKSTAELSKVKVNGTLSVIYPLGNSFPLNEANPLLIGGGVGAAPLYYLARQYNAKGIKPHVLIGARTEKQLFCTEKFKQVSHMHISTQDGSCGEKGLVTENSVIKEEFSSFITCGPQVMMKALAQKAKEMNIKCYVSLENRMACGIGACLCCVCQTKSDGNQCVCSEGAVFDADNLIW